MDESKKQKVLYGILAVTVALTLAINFWPASPPAFDNGPISVRPVSATPDDPPQEFTVQRDQEEDPIAERRARRPADDENGAIIRRAPQRPAEKDQVVPSV